MKIRLRVRPSPTESFEWQHPGPRIHIGKEDCEFVFRGEGVDPLGVVGDDEHGVGGRVADLVDVEVASHAGQEVVSVGMLLVFAQEDSAAQVQPQGLGSQQLGAVAGVTGGAEARDDILSDDPVGVIGD